MIQRAVEILRRGGLVAFPTETVYGLGADATNSIAVDRIFTAKGRPSTNPLIVHVASIQIAKRYVAQWPVAADDLAKHFWPGPLTLVLPKHESITNKATAGRDSVGLRVPNHAIALELCTAFDGPIAAPSANRANRISPTRAEHVRAELGDAVELILDGGPCAIGIESTVIDLTGIRPCVLRPGDITRQQLEAVVGPVDLFQGAIDPTIASSSPGQQSRHYSPVTPSFRFESSQQKSILTRKNSVILIPGNTGGLVSPSQIVQMRDDPRAYAQQLYQALRAADSINPAAIFIEMPPDQPAWYSVRDRLIRATSAVE